MADFRTATPTAGVSCATSGEVFVISMIAVNGRPLYLKRLKVGARSTANTDLPMGVRIVQYATDGTGTTNTPIAVDSDVTASVPTGKHTYTVAPSGASRVLWEGTAWPQSTESLSLIDPATGVGIKLDSNTVCVVGITARTSTQTVDAQLFASD
jgi:hypothetical protein